MATADAHAIRQVLKNLEPSVSHTAAQAPENLDEIYAPAGHAAALDWTRALVVGGRGVGKSFWASVLASSSARQRVSKDYPRLALDTLEAALGFHEAARGTADIAPSPAVLGKALGKHVPAVSIWKAVLARALVLAGEDCAKGKPLEHWIDWVENNPEAFENALIAADRRLGEQHQRFLLVFDALDRLGSDWPTVRELMKGIAQLALDLQSMRCVRAKIFMRRDQFLDQGVMNFPDSSKLKTAHVDLKWERHDLYGLLFNALWRDKNARATLLRHAGPVRSEAADARMPVGWKSDTELQQALFAKIAGPFMGANHRRGRTYTWLHGHLSDAFGAASPRIFLIALKEAANRAGPDLAKALDHHGLRAGVLKASQACIDELHEDYPWVGETLSALAGLIVPCPPSDFMERWRDRGTVAAIQSRPSGGGRPPTPIELDFNRENQEAALIDALIKIGIIERRESIGQINVPDIFRVAAHLKRRGGVPPRPRR